MVQINFAQRQVNAKIVYYGPGMSGKTTNLEVIHQRAPENNRGDLTSISTDGDRTLFFDFMPLDLGTVAGMRTCFQIYTVPGQVYYNSTRKLVLQGVDGVVFVADSQSSMVQENVDSMNNLVENLREYGRELEDLPLVIQYNKRDLADAMSVEELEALLNPRGVPSFEAVANTGQGVFPTLKALAAEVLAHIHRQQRSALGSGARGATPQALSQSGFHAPPAAVPSPAAAPSASTPPTTAGSPQDVPRAPIPTAAPDAQVAACSAEPAPATGSGSPDLSVTTAYPAAAPTAPEGTADGPSLRIAGLDAKAHPQAQTPESTAPQRTTVPGVGGLDPAPSATPPGFGIAPPMTPAAPAPQAAPAAATAPAPPAAPRASAPHPMQPGSEATAMTARQSRAVPRSRVRTVPRPTPQAPSNRRGVWITALIVVGSVGIGAALGSFVLSLF